MAGSILGFSLPTFWVGLMLIMVFAVQLGWLPSTGRGTTAELFGVQWSFLTLDGLRHLLLPALNLSLFNISLVLRLTRAGVRETLPMDFVKFARAKGLSPARVIFVHVLKNIMIPIVTVVGLEFGSTIAFAVVTESVFAWPGMGKLIIDFDQRARSAGDCCLPDDDRAAVRDDQPGGRRALYCARSARAAGDKG